ncbi:MAG TPA: T9SS type B sorting domain-containing protein, partial [Flavobacteriales bacterium]|nr:T9SS type B sorting domain-containing protein [Flavobacteriales bacterium]
YTYLWDTNANSQTDSTATGLSAGTYYVTVSDWASCFAIDSVGIIDAGSGPNSTSSANNASCSESTDGNATAIASGGAGAPYSYLWDTNAGSQTASVATGLSTGTYLVTITDQGSCTTIDSVTVSNAGLGPIVSAGSDTTIALGASAQLNGSGGPTYAWTPSATLNCSDCDNPVATPDSTTTYFLTVTDSNNCTSSDSVIVTVETFVDELFVPTLFSPNADQMNDIFYVRGNGIDWIEIVIYDRWGKKIYGGDKSQVWAEDNNYPTDKGWDGSYQGKPLNPAVFVYIIKGAFDSGAEIEEKGNITLVR